MLNETRYRQHSRKEFFRVSLDAVERAAGRFAPDTEFIRMAVAEEFRESAAIRARAQESIENAAATRTPSEVDAARARLEELRSSWRAEPVA